MDTDIMQDLCLNLVLLGRTGVGKSSSGNTILGREAFISKKSSTLVTHSVAAEVSQVSGLPITVYDTPGFSDTELSKEDLWKYEEILQKCESGLCAFLLVLRADRFTKEDQEVLEKIEELLGAKRIQNTWILFTRGDELEEENKTIDKVIKETEYLKNLSQKFEGRQHVLDNKHIRRRDGQVNSLISKVFYRNLENLSRRQRIPVKIQEIPVEHRFTRRIVLLGKSGVGKSAAANTILGQKVFKSTVGSNSVTRECSVKHANISDKKVSVVDTPGFFDTHMSPEQLMIEIVRSVYISSPGPHAFLIVFPVNRFTQQEEEIPQIIEMLFGEDVLKYSIILFTHGDQLEGKTIETMINENSRLRDLVDQCGGRFHVFNNRDESNREQVNDLLQKIDTMIEQNGGGHYSNQMFEDAQRFRQEEEIERVIRAEIQHENNLRQEEGENQRQEEVEILVKQTKQTIRAEIQRENNARKQQEEIQRREEIERVRRHTEQRVRAKIQHEINVSQHDEKKKRQEEIERVRRQTEERIRAEIQHESNVRQQQEEIQRREEIERVRAECEAQMMSELERLRAVRKRKEEKRKQQDNQRQEEIERVRRQTEERRAEIERENNVRKQQEEIQKREEIERVRRQTERRIKAECKAQMMPEIERLRTERQRDREKIKQQDNQRREEIERVRRQTEERVRAEIERENNVRKQQEKKQNTQYIEKRSGFNKFFSKFWKYFLMGIVAGTIIGGGNSDGIVNGIVVLIVDKRQGNH